MSFDFTKRLTKERKEQFAVLIKGLSRIIGFKVSSRGWCYIMEQKGYINKDQFDKVTNAINDCRKEGLIPVDFVAEEKARAFTGVEEPTTRTLESILKWMVTDVLEGAKYYTPNWWNGETYYIQMVVEKIDLVTLFEPVCREYHIPIANAKGWSSISQRAEYSRRFREAEDMGLKCVLLYCGDHDPDGLRISETLRSNLEDVKDVTWTDGAEGYDPENLIIDRFGLNYDFIINNEFTWIDNLITGSGKNLASTNHVNNKMDYVQDYLQKIGERKCEANVIVTLPEVARALCTEAIEFYLGEDSAERFQLRRDEIDEQYEEILEKFEVKDPIQKIIDSVEDDE